VAQVLAEVDQGPVALERGENGLLYPVDPELASVGSPRDLRVVSLNEVGVDWYTKTGEPTAFGASGRVINVEAGQGGLAEAILGAQEGDIVRLAPGEHIVDRSIALSTTVAVEGAGADQTTILFTRPSLFELREGGSLRLRGLGVDGELTPDSVGNSMIRTGIFPIQSNIRVELDAVTVRNLKVNKSFNVLTLGKNTLADHVTITDSSFEGITGTIVSAKAETEDYGQYNVEYLTIEDSSFARIGGPVADIYRGGRDESTFGPNVTISANTLSDVGFAATNGTGGSVNLHGVQIARIDENTLSASAPLRIVHTVGTPSTTPHRAALSGNVYDEGGKQ